MSEVVFSLFKELSFITAKLFGYTAFCFSWTDKNSKNVSSVVLLSTCTILLTWKSQVPSHVSNCLLIYSVGIFRTIHKKADNWKQSYFISAVNSMMSCISWQTPNKSVLTWISDMKIQCLCSWPQSEEDSLHVVLPWKRILEIILQCQRWHALWFVTQKFGFIEFYQYLNLEFLISMFWNALILSSRPRGTA